MMDSVVAHLARRGVHMGVKCMHKMNSQFPPATPESSIQIQQNENKNPLEDLLARLKTPAAIGTFVATTTIFFLSIILIEYALRIVALNLTAVEDSAGTGNIKLPVDDEPSQHIDVTKTPLLDDVDDDYERGPAPSTKPVTRSLRSTFRHLRASQGAFSPLRGLKFALFYSLSMGLLSLVFTSILSFLGPFGIPLGRVLAAILACNAHATWTHATIAKPSSVSFFKRFLPRSVARQLILPTIRLHLGMILSQVGTLGAAALVAHLNRDRVTPLTASAALLPIVVFFAVNLLHVIPSHIALVRVEAALLPETEECVVPLDRTFGGKIQSREAFATRRAYVAHNLMLKGAWATIDRATYVRVMKVLVKMVGILLFLAVVYTGIVAAELHFFAGDEVKNVVRFMRNGHSTT